MQKYQLYMCLPLELWESKIHLNEAQVVYLANLVDWWLGCNYYCKWKIYCEPATSQSGQCMHKPIHVNMIMKRR